jgi:ribose transport system ATP-binding protein
MIAGASPRRDPGPVLPPTLSVRGLSKAFTGTHALTDVDLDLLPGEIHALVGQNGSGKSTLIKILSGYHAPDAGSVAVQGHPLRLPITPRSAESARLRFVHQNPGLSPTFSVVETIRMRNWSPTWYGRIRWSFEREYVRDLLSSVGLDVDPDVRINDLTPSQRAVVAILRALQGMGVEPAVLVLDEPTAYLNKADADQLFDTLRQLKSRGHAVLFVSHRLDEVLAIADRITVLRDGHVVTRSKTGEVTEGQLIASILGRDLGALYPGPPTTAGDAIFRVHDLTGSTITGFTCAVGAGEILGITGLGGMGQDEVPYLMFGALSAIGGRIFLHGRELVRLTPRKAVAAGMALLTADREVGGVRRATLTENVTMATVGKYYVGGWLRTERERTDVRRLLGQFEVRPNEPDRLLGTLSGGNQQKTLLAKWLQVQPVVLLLHEPTQGVDVGSRQQVFRMIRDAAAKGTAVVVASSEYADLAHICSRVVVMRRGRAAAQLEGDELTEDRLVQACYSSTS